MTERRVTHREFRRVYRVAEQTSAQLQRTDRHDARYGELVRRLAGCHIVALQYLEQGNEARGEREMEKGSWLPVVVVLALIVAVGALLHVGWRLVA